MESYDHICRICLQSHDAYQTLKGFLPYDKLVNYTRLKISINIGEPHSICTQCITELQTTVDFLQKCERSNEILATKSLYSSQKETIPEKIELEVVTNSVDSKANHMLDVIYKESDSSPEQQCRSHSSPVKFICNHCQKVFTRKFNFTLHLKRHTGEREWACPTCGVQQLTSWLARRHCAPRPRHTCPIPGCHKTFTTNTNLNTHIRVHKGERPYKCEECTKTFSCKSTLKDHSRIHTGVKPYMCPVCGKRFTTNKLSSHMHTHAVSAAPRRQRTGPAVAREPHLCRLCPARYNHKQSLNKHLRKHHAQQTDTTTSLSMCHV